MNLIKSSRLEVVLSFFVVYPGVFQNVTTLGHIFDDPLMLAANIFSASSKSDLI
jgi:hypothetical protein